MASEDQDSEAVPDRATVYLQEAVSRPALLEEHFVERELKGRARAASTAFRARKEDLSARDQRIQQDGFVDDSAYPEGQKQPAIRLSIGAPDAAGFEEKFARPGPGLTTDRDLDVGSIRNHEGPKAARPGDGGWAFRAGGKDSRADPQPVDEGIGTQTARRGSAACG